MTLVKLDKAVGDLAEVMIDDHVAVVVEKNDEMLEAFLRDVLGVDAEQAEIDACKLEHLLSLESSMKLAAFVQFLNADRKAARSFLRAFRRDRPHCEHDVARCEICGTTCLAEPLPKQPLRKRAPRPAVK